MRRNIVAQRDRRAETEQWRGVEAAWTLWRAGY